MSTFRNPVGPQPSRVYWRRRLVLLLGLLAVVLVIVLIVVRPGSGAPAGASSSSGKPAVSPAASAAAVDPGTAGACDPAKIVVDALTDATAYDLGSIPQLTFSIKSTATEPCTFSAGSDVQEFVITSGEERIWDSKDCQTSPVAASALLLPGVPKAGTPIPWDRTRSATDTCASERPPVVAGGASYHLDVIVNGVKSSATRQFLLN